MEHWSHQICTNYITLLNQLSCYMSEWNANKRHIVFAYISSQLCSYEVNITWIVYWSPLLTVNSSPVYSYEKTLLVCRALQYSYWILVVPRYHFRISSWNFQYHDIVIYVFIKYLQYISVINTISTPASLGTVVIYTNFNNLDNFITLVCK